MWLSESFTTLELLLAFLNDRRIRPEQCKVVVTHDDANAEVFHVLYRLGDEVVVSAAVAQAEADPLDGADADNAVDAAEAIIAEAHRDE